MKDTRKILGIVNWMIPKNSDHGIFYAQHLWAPNEKVWHRQAKVINLTDISIPAKVIEDKAFKCSQAKILAEHTKFLKDSMMRS